MTDEQYNRLSNLVSATVEQQAQFSEDLRRLGEQTKANNEGIRALLAIAEIHERENQATNERFQATNEGMKATDERLNVLINIVERHINGHGKTP